jgi:hypothetical protein
MKKLTVVLTALIAGAAHAGTGTTTAEFLRIAPDSRSAALGHTGVCDPDNGFATFHNPALAAASSDPVRLSAGQTQWLMGSQISHAAATVQRKTRAGAWGLGLTFSRLATDPFQTTDGLGNTTGKTSFGAQAAGASLSRSWGGVVSVGAGIKSVEQGFDAQPGTRNTISAWDAGVFARSKSGRWSIGAALKNAGASSTNDGVSEELPTALRAGMEWRPGDGQFTWSVDVARPKSGSAAVGAGLGFRASNALTLRAGYDGRTAGSQYAGLTSGLGVKVGSFSIDYAFTPFGELGNAQRISVSWAHGGARREARSKRRAARGGEIQFRRTRR